MGQKKNHIWFYIAIFCCSLTELKDQVDLCSMRMILLTHSIAYSEAYSVISGLKKSDNLKTKNDFLFHFHYR